MTDQSSLFDDPAIAVEERELFGDRVRPVRPALDEEGDFIVGPIVEIAHDVDLKTEFGPVDIVILEAMSGVLAGRTKRPPVGQHFAWAVLHATAKNQLAAFDPEPQPGERIAIRRGREFKSNQGESAGKTLTSWDVVLPDRPRDEPPYDPTEEPF